MKQAIFLIVDHGMEGRDKESIQYAFTDETERDQCYEKHPNKGYYTTVDRVVDLEAHRVEALRKLNGLDKLALNLQDTPPKKKGRLFPVLSTTKDMVVDGHLVTR